MAVTTVTVPLEFVADASVDLVSPVDGSISNPPRGGVFGSGSLADLDDVNYLHLWGTHRFQSMPPGLDQFTYSLPAAVPASAVVSSASLTFQAKLLDFPDGIVILRDSGEVMPYTAWEGTPDARMYTTGGQATAQDLHFVFDDAPAFDLAREVNTFDYASHTIPLSPTMLDWSTAHSLSIFAWDGDGTSRPTAQLRVTQALITITYATDDAPPIAGCGHPTRSIPGPTHGDPAFPGAVTVPSTIVGGELALSDDSDATYADHAPYDGWSAQTRALFPGYASTVDRKFKLQFRAQRFDAGDNQNGITVFLANQASTDGWLSASYFAPDMAATPEWLVTAEATIPAGAATSDGLMVGINVFRTDGGGGDLVLRVFDVELCWSESLVVPIASRFIPPAQLSGRADGLGPLGGAPRLDTRAPSRQSGFHPGGYY